MASLTGKNVNTSYKDLLTVAGSTEGQGIDSALKQIFDGNGDGTAMSLSSTEIGVKGSYVLDGVNDYIFKKSTDTQFKINSDGVVVLRELGSVPTAVEGGMYFDGTHFYVGI
jgi:hypothetical protein